MENDELVKICPVQFLLGLHIFAVVKVKQHSCWLFKLKYGLVAFVILLYVCKILTVGAYHSGTFSGLSQKKVAGL
jgi:hypothetical protein